MQGVTNRAREPWISHKKKRLSHQDDVLHRTRPLIKALNSQDPTLLGKIKVRTFPRDPTFSQLTFAVLLDP